MEQEPVEARPKLLLVSLHYSPEPTGNAPYATGLARNLSQWFDVRVLTAHPHYPIGRRFDGFGGWSARTVEDDVEIVRLAHYIPKKRSTKTRLLSESTFAARVLLARRRAWRPDVVVALSPGLVSAGSAALLARRLGVPFGLVVQDIYSLALGSAASANGALSRLVRSGEAATFRGAQSLVTVHDRMAASISRLAELDESAITVIRNWTHTAAPETPREKIRERFGWRTDEKILLHAGNMGAKQGLSNLVDAARLADAMHTPLRVVLLGDGNDRPHLVEQSRGIASISFIPPVAGDEFSSVLAAADVLCVNELPGLEEMCAPSKLTSYFATGLPVVAATEAFSAAAHDVEASGAGVVVRPGDPRALHDAALSLATDEGRLRGSRGPDFADKWLSETAAVTAYRSWLDGLLRQNR